MTGINVDEIRAIIPAIRSEDQSLRMRSLESLPKIAQVLRSQRTRDELIPFTIDTPEHSPAALITIARVLGQMLKEVGGRKYISSLLSALSFICENENAEVRSAAVSALVSLCMELPSSERSSVFLPFITTMCKDGWYPLRAAGCSLLCELYSQMSHASLDELLTQLSTDPIVRVRRTVLLSLHFLFVLSEPPPIAFKLLTTLVADECVSIAVEVPPVLAVLSPAHRDFVIRTVASILISKIWQAQVVLIANIDKIFPSNPPLELVKKVAGVGHSSTLAAALARQLPFFFESKCYPTLDEFRSFATALVHYPDASVRAAVAGSLGSMPPDAAPIVESLLATLLADREQNVVMAALRTASASGSACAAAVRQIQGLLAAQQWRVKVTVAELLPAVAGAFELGTVSSDLVPVIKALFLDEAADVRAALVKALPAIVSKLGPAWQSEVMFPMIAEMLASGDYQMRKTAVAAITTLGLDKELAELVQRAAEDPVPNVRLVAAKELPRGSEVLTRLKSDPDPDVAFFASKA
jgi:HEAT repeat protein